MLCYGSPRKLRHAFQHSWLRPIELELSSGPLREALNKKRWGCDLSSGIVTCALKALAVYMALGETDGSGEPSGELTHSCIVTYGGSDGSSWSSRAG